MGNTRLSSVAVTLLAAFFASGPALALDVERLERAWTEATGLESIDIRSVRSPNPFVEGLADGLLGDPSNVLLHSTIRATVASGGVGADVRCDLTESEGALRIRRCRDLVGGVGLSVLNSWSRTGTLDFELPAESPSSVSDRSNRLAEEPARARHVPTAGAPAAI